MILIEKNRRPGVKILMSGGTRCNITNARGLRRLDVVSGPIDSAHDSNESRGVRAIQQAFGQGGAFLGPSLKALDVDRTIQLFEDEGVATKIEANGKVFCLVDAPDAETAARVHQEAHGLLADHIHEVVEGS